ncbi:MAG: hypothetical protein H0V17_29275, partial [Deltaproteobacteria bacterium]|nr:hypothetical protein [Deltaproteobacteria bacterium]
MSKLRILERQIVVELVGAQVIARRGNWELSTDMIASYPFPLRAPTFALVELTPGPTRFVHDENRAVIEVRDASGPLPPFEIRFTPDTSDVTRRLTVDPAVLERNQVLTIDGCDLQIMKETPQHFHVRHIIAGASGREPKLVARGFTENVDEFEERGCDFSSVTYELEASKRHPDIKCDAEWVEWNGWLLRLADARGDYRLLLRSKEAEDPPAGFDDHQWDDAFSQTRHRWVHRDELAGAAPRIATFAPPMPPPPGTAPVVPEQRLSITERAIELIVTGTAAIVRDDKGWEHVTDLIAAYPLPLDAPVFRAVLLAPMASRRYWKANCVVIAVTDR